MNIAHPGVHPQRAIGMTSTGSMGMGFGSYGNTAPTSNHQRSPFAIQELLGLGHQQEANRRPNQHEAMIQVSPYMQHPGSLSGGHNQCISDPANAHGYNSWRSTFMAFSGQNVQNVLHLTNGQNTFNQQSVDIHSGKN